MIQAINDQKPGILMVCGGMGAGGKERQLINLLQFMNTAGHFSVYLAVMNPGGIHEEEARKYTEGVYNIPRLFTGDVILPLVHLIRIIKRFKIKLIHSWGSGIWDITSLVVAKLCEIPFLHGGIRSAPTKLRFSHRLSKLSALNANAIVANSMAGLSAFGLLDHPHAKVIYNGMNLTRFEGIDNNPVDHSLCMVANFSKKKDHRTLISVMPTVIKTFPDVCLTLVGHDAGTLDEIVSMVNNLGITDHVEYITNTKAPEPYIAKSQICILSTFSEGISNALLEYMALGKPVIATDVSGNKEVVIPTKTGNLVQVGDPVDLADNIIELLSNPLQASKMGEEGFCVVRTKFSLEKMGQEYQLLYNHLIGG